MHAFLESVVFAAIVLAPIFASIGLRPLSVNELPINIERPRHPLPENFARLDSAPCAE